MAERDLCGLERLLTVALAPGSGRAIGRAPPPEGDSSCPAGHPGWAYSPRREGWGLLCSRLCPWEPAAQCRHFGLLGHEAVQNLLDHGAVGRQSLEQRN